MLNYISDTRAYQILKLIGDLPLTKSRQAKLGILDDEMTLLQSLGLAEQAADGWVVSSESAKYWIEEYEESHAFHHSASAYWLLVILLVTNLVVGVALMSMK